MGLCPCPAPRPALTEVRVALAVVPCHVRAAAPVALADATLVQRVGGEEHPVTADGLQEAGETAMGRRRGGRGPPLPWREAAGRVRAAYFATMFNNLTFSRHANPSQFGELAGRAVPGGHHELPLAVHSGAVQVTGLAGDVDVVIWGAGRGSQGREGVLGPGSARFLLLRQHPPHPTGEQTEVWGAERVCPGSQCQRGTKVQIVRPSPGSTGSASL